jgi:hypothetical protein
VGGHFGRDWKRGRGGRGGERSARKERAKQHWVRAEAAASATGEVRAGTGDVVGGGPAAGSMAVAVPFAGFDTLMRRYQEYRALEDPQPFLRDRASYKPVLGIQAFTQGQGDIAVFATIYEIMI